MKLWLISQDVNNNYDTYDIAVVAAETEKRASFMHPYSGDIYPAGSWERPAWSLGDWCGRPVEVAVRYIGEAAPGTEEGVVLASFNAG